jgi:hypothetical protein
MMNLQPLSGRTLARRAAQIPSRSPHSSSLPSLFTLNHLSSHSELRVSNSSACYTGACPRHSRWGSSWLVRPVPRAGSTRLPICPRCRPSAKIPRPRTFHRSTSIGGRGCQGRHVFSTIRKPGGQRSG